jgi:hypothetical protein
MTKFAWRIDDRDWSPTYDTRDGAIAAAVESMAVGETKPGVYLLEIARGSVFNLHAKWLAVAATVFARDGATGLVETLYDATFDDPKDCQDSFVELPPRYLTDIDPAHLDSFNKEVLRAVEKFLCESDPENVTHFTADAIEALHLIHGPEDSSVVPAPTAADFKSGDRVRIVASNEQLLRAIGWEDDCMGLDYGVEVHICSIDEDGLISLDVSDEALDANMLTLVERKAF